MTKKDIIAPISFVAAPNDVSAHRLVSYDAVHLQYVLKQEDLVRKHPAGVTSIRLRFLPPEATTFTVGLLQQLASSIDEDAPQVTGNKTVYVFSGKWVAELRAETEYGDILGEDDEEPTVASSVEGEDTEVFSSIVVLLTTADASIIPTIKRIFGKQKFIYTESNFTVTKGIPITYAFPGQRGVEYITKSFDPIQLEGISCNYAPDVVESVTRAKEIIAKSTHGLVLLGGPVGCHAKGQGILMYTGSRKQVEDIVVGDVLMGPDSKPRDVLTLYRGRGNLVRVVPTKGTPFIVNDTHILTLVETNNKDKTHTGLFDISVKDYLGEPHYKQRGYLLVRTGVDFPTIDTSLPIEPYILGLLIGDGCLMRRVSLTTSSNIIADYFCSFVKSYGLEIDTCPGSGCRSFYATPRRKGKNLNRLVNEVRALGLLNKRSGDKFIPTVYKVAPRKDRLALLAGLIDTDGSVSNNVCDYTTKSKRLAEDIVFLARSLGFAAYVYETTKGCQTGYVGTYYRLCISGDLSCVPTKLPNKKFSTRRQKKSVLRTGFTVEQVGIGDYYGFELSGDGRYVLDDLTITHNTGKTFLVRSLLSELGAVRHGVVCSPASHFLTEAGEMHKIISNFSKTIIVLEDIGNLLEIDAPSTQTDQRANLLNLSEGLMSLLGDAVIVLTFNHAIDKIDPAVMRPGRCLAQITVGLLPYEQALTLYSPLPEKREYSLAEVYQLKNTGTLSIGNEPVKRKLGFRGNNA